MRARVAVLLIAAAALAGCGGGAAERRGDERTVIRGLAHVDSAVKVTRMGRSWLVVRDFTASVPARWGLKVRYSCRATYSFWPRRGWSAWRCGV
jgi:hypothetical protein